MCGLFGWYLKPGAVPMHKVAIMAAILASENETRGPDSFGIAFESADKKGIAIEKGVGRVTAKCDVSKYVQSPIVLGHTRRATSGPISHDNAHPWLIKGIVGAHNGWVTNKAELDAKYPDRKCQVDSMHIFHHLGDDLDLNELKVHGTITFMRTSELGKVYLLRSQTGELAVHGIGKDRKKPIGIMWSSEALVASTALSLAGLEHWQFDVKPRRLYTIENCVLYRNNGEITFDPQYSTRFNNNEHHHATYPGADSWKPGWTWNNETKKYEPPLDHDDKHGSPSSVIREFHKGEDVTASPQALTRSLIKVRDVRRFNGDGKTNNKGEGPADVIQRVATEALITNQREAYGYMLKMRSQLEQIACDGCREVGDIVVNHAFVGVRFYYEVNQWLCNSCGKVWGLARGGQA